MIQVQKIGPIATRALACGAILFLSLANMPGQLAAAAESEADDAIFYPMPPQLPRLQFLKSFTSALDSSAEDEGMRGFLFGGKENERPLVNKPYGVAIHEGAIHVVDTRGFGWGVFDVAGGKSYFVTPSGGGALRKPINITIDVDGTKYVTDTDREQVVVFNAANKYVSAFGEPDQFKPIDVAIAGDRLYVSDAKNHKIHVLDKHSGDVLFSFGEAGSSPGQLFHPTGVTIATDGDVYVVDMSNFRVQRFSAEGVFEFEFGGQGSVAGRFTRPKGIAIDNENHVYVVDAAFQNLQVFDQKGGALMAFGKPGAERDSINIPTVVKIDYDNVKYFQNLAAPGFTLEYLVLVVAQMGLNKVVVYGYGTFDE